MSRGGESYEAGGQVVLHTWKSDRVKIRGYTEIKISSVSHGILGTRGRLRTLNDMSVSWLFRWYSLVSVKGAEEELKAYEGETNGSTRYHGCRGNDLFEQSLSRDSCVESLLSKVVLSGGLCWQHQRFRVMFKKRCSFRLLQRNSQKFGVYRLLRLTRIESKIFRIRSSSTGVIGLPSKTTSWFSEEDTEELSQVILDVEKQLRETNTTRPSLEEQSQESITSVSELNSTEPVSAAPIQEDQAKESSPTIQKEEQPVQDVMVSIIQDMKEKEAPKEPQSDCELNQLIVFDPCDFQNTFFGTFLISPFVWNKPRAVEPSRHELGINHVVFEPGGELWSHRNNTIMIEKRSAAITIVFGDLLPFGDKVSHVSTQQEFHYETNCRMLPTMSWIQKTRQQRKWPPDDQDIVNFTKHIGLAQLCEMLISDYAERTSWGSKELEVDQNVLLLDHVKSLDKLEMQQSNLGNCLATSVDIGEVRGSYLYNQRELTNKLDCNGNFTYQGLTSNWNHVQSFSGERVMDSTSRVIMCLLCLNLSEFKTSQSYQWRPSEHAKHSRRNYKRDEDKRFKPPDLDQDKHQAVPVFIIIKEAPPDATYKQKPSKNKFGIRLLLYDDFACAGETWHGFEFDTRKAVREYLRSITGETSKSAYVSGVHCSGVDTKEPSMMQDNTCLPISGRVRLVVHKQAHRKLKSWNWKKLHEGSMTNRRAQVVDGDAQVSVLETSQHKKGIEIMNSQLSKGGISGILDKISHEDREESQGVSWSICLSSSDSWMAGHVQSNNVSKDFDSRLSAHEWNQEAKEKINLKKDVQVSVQALEQLGSQLKTIDEGFKKIMKGLQAWLKMKLREVKRYKKRQRDAEDEQTCSIIRRCQHKGRVMDLDHTCGVY
ncbi:hypothetical protein F2Q68_00044289 [Brassica cretica]|uniref:Uncharacterized protein n=1 Tax=Brassica cretica TaxID=69181 RepID=A0A8S9LIK0_BRACR|nr:hypothetical protein F2Q68_00044289 [Brassica cretica]